MLEIRGHTSPFGQTNLLISSITVALSFLVRPISAAEEEETIESDELYSSDEDNSEYEDKAPIDIRPLRDSRMKHGNLSRFTAFTVDPSFQTTLTTTTTGSSELITSEELYTGTFKYIHNRKDFNYSYWSVTMPTVIGTLFTLNPNQWKGIHQNRSTDKDVKLLDPSMIKLFTNRENNTDTHEYRRFVLWANKKYRRNLTAMTSATTPSLVQSTFTLYPKEFENDTAFREYMSKNWANTSYKEYASRRNKSARGYHYGRPWMDNIASREFHSKPWRAKNVSEDRYYKSWRRRVYYEKGFHLDVDGNETVGEYYERPWKRRRPYWMAEGNETAVGEYGQVPRKGRRPYWMIEGNGSAISEFGPRPWRQRRPNYKFPEGNETESADWRGARPYYPRLYRKELYYRGEENDTAGMGFERRSWKTRDPYYDLPYRREFHHRPDGNETVSVRFERRPWRERRRYQRPGALIDRDQREFDPQFNHSRDFEERPWPERPFRNWGPPPWADKPPPRRYEFEPRSYESRRPWADERDPRRFEPPGRDSREFDSQYEREFEPRLSIRPTESKSLSREFDERPLPPRDREFDPRRPLPRAQEELDDRPPGDRNSEHQILWRRKEELDDRPSRDRVLEDRKPLRGREEIGDRPPRDRDSEHRVPWRRNEELDDRPSRDRDLKDRKPLRGREELDDRPPRDRDLKDRKPLRGREEFGDRPPRDRNLEHRIPWRRKEEIDDRPPRDRDSEHRISWRRKEELDDRPSKVKDFDERKPTFDDKPSKDKYFDDQRPSRGREEFETKRLSEEFPSEEKFDSTPTGDDTTRHSYGTTDKKVLSITRKDRDFYARNKGSSFEGKSSTRSPFEVQAKFYRQRIEQRREKELQKIEKRRRMFWRPTDSAEATAQLETTTTTMKTTTRRTYNKMKKGKDMEEAEVMWDWSDDETETETETTDVGFETDPMMKVTHPYDDEYMREWAERREKEEETNAYDWITSPAQSSNEEKNAFNWQSRDHGSLTAPQVDSYSVTEPETSTVSLQAPSNEDQNVKKKERKRSKTGKYAVSVAGATPQSKKTTLRTHGSKKNKKKSKSKG